MVKTNNQVKFSHDEDVSNSEENLVPGSKIGSDLWLSEYLSPWDIYVHGISRVLVNKQTPYQQMSVVETENYGNALVLDGKWQSSIADEFLYHEPLIHPAMFYHGEPKNVLILGAGEGATAREVLRWESVEQIVTVDLDGEVVEACRQYLPEMHAGAFDHPKVKLIIGNALEYLDNTTQKWDIVVFDLSDAIAEGPSFQLFTKECFARIRRILKPEGFMMMQAGSLLLSQLHLHARLINTVNAVFPHVQPYSSFIPSFGEPWGFAIASAREIDTQIDPDKVDYILETKTTGGFKMFDGTTLLGLMQTPGHIRKLIATETEIFTQAEPLKAFGKGISNSS